MTEPDILSRKIHELKDWQTVAWRRVADPLLTAFERREIRNHLKESNGELRRYLEMMSDRPASRLAQSKMSAIASQALSSDFLLRDCAEMLGG